MTLRPDRVELAPGLEISRVVTGLWQVADQERSGTKLDATRAATDLAAYAAAGFDTFDMADHYGSAEEIIGRLAEMRSADPSIPAYRAFTKWCPEPGPMTPAVVRAGVERACKRMGTGRIDLMQF
ncbi:MAG: aldo/keto reductase, partial [Rhizobiales bacterium]|nr:aldo/keto reductase [Hyphomicrobiales bacterium]